MWVSLNSAKDAVNRSGAAHCSSYGAKRTAHVQMYESVQAAISAS